MLRKIDVFVTNVLLFNKKRNIISKSTENDIWNRHILDSAQLTKYILPDQCNGLADLGSGAGFPGIVLAIYFANFNFHVKLYEKSPIKSAFLVDIAQKLNLNVNVVCSDINSEIINSNYIVSRAFKKLPQILNISRENCKKTHKMIIMKGRNAQEEIKKALKEDYFKYRLEKSITNNDSWIIILDVEKKL